MPGTTAINKSRTPRMLIVDDEESITRTMQLMFEERGFSVVTAASCAEALNALSNGHKFDAVITDLNMETADIGLEVARAAKRAHPAPVVVVCTGYANVNNTRIALDIHVDYLATKPVDLELLFLAVDRLLAHRASAVGTRAKPSRQSVIRKRHT